MILNEREMQQARSLARELVRVEREKEVERMRLARLQRQRETQEAFESLGRVTRNVNQVLEDGFIKPLARAQRTFVDSFINGLRG